MILYCWGDEMRRDIYNFERRLEIVCKSIECSDDITQCNKKLILDFLDDCRIDGAGWGSPLRLATIVRHAYSLLFNAKQIKKDFRKADRNDIKEIFKKIELSKCKDGKNSSEYTKRHYKVGLKKFFKWINGGDEYPDCIKWMKIRCNDEKKYPWVNITEEDSIAMVKVCENPRDRAIIMCLTESNGRIGEVATPQIKHLKKTEYGYSVLFDGKTNERPIPLIASAPYITDHLNSHPDKDNPEAYLWPRLHGKNAGKPMDYDNFRMMLQRRAKRAGVNKRVNPHSFRHAGATRLWKVLKNDPMAMNRYHGWSPNSNMWKIYLHLSEEDVKDPLLEFYGIKKKEEKVTSHLKPKVCRSCQQVNGITNAVCEKCGKPLDKNNPMDLEQQKNIDSNAMMETLSQPEFLESFVNKMVETKLNEILKMKDAHPNLNPEIKKYAMMMAQA